MSTSTPVIPVEPDVIGPFRGVSSQKRQAQRAFVLHEHDRPRHHFDLRLEEGGVLQSWAVPKGLPPDARSDRLAVRVDDHDLAHLTYEDADKRIADIGTWELHDRNERRSVFTLHGSTSSVRYALISTSRGLLLHRMSK